MRSYSDYGHFAGVIGCLAFLVIGVVFVLSAVVLLLFLPTPKLWNRILIGAFLTVGLLCVQFMFAVLFSFEVMHLAGTAILAFVFTITLPLPPLLILINPRTWQGLYFRFHCCCFWKDGKRQQPPAFLGSKIFSGDGGREEEGCAGEEAMSGRSLGSSGAFKSEGKRKPSPKSSHLIGTETSESCYSVAEGRHVSGDVIRRHVPPPTVVSPLSKSPLADSPSIDQSNARSNNGATTPPCQGEAASSVGWYYAAESRSTMTLLGYIHSVTDNKILLAVGVVAVIIVEVLLNVMLAHGCGCLYPYSYTTWASRAATRVCNDMESVCHGYTTLGNDYSSLLAIGHFVTKTEVANYNDLVVSATFCPVSVGANGRLTDFQLSAESFSQSALMNCTSSSVQRTGRWIPSATLSEDIRYIGVVPLNPLTEDTIYQVRMDFVRGGTAVYSKRWYVRSLPSSSSVKNITFVAGGDFQSGSIGRGLLGVGISKARQTAGVGNIGTTVDENDVRFASLGGDLSYENNIRYCYDRVDTVLNTFSTLQRSDGTYVPLVTAVGNHEAGGYLTASDNMDQRQRHYYFYPRYFPSISDTAYTNTVAYQSASTFFVDGDFSVTYHHHIIGRTAWIVLDSGIMFRLEEQASYLDSKLAEFVPMVSVSNASGATKVVPPTAGSPLKSVVVVYHNPAYPSARAFTNANSVAVREHFVSKIDSNSPQVRWVLEHHDHQYKRTKILKNGNVVGDISAATMGAGGAVYSGDGSLGVHMQSRHGIRQYYHAEMLASNYVLVANLQGSSTDITAVRASAFNSDGDEMDSFYV